MNRQIAHIRRRASPSDSKPKNITTVLENRRMRHAVDVQMPDFLDVASIVVHQEKLGGLPDSRGWS
jgi:hypothetical protein